VLFLFSYLVPMQHKCSWCLGDPLYEVYHDQVWGVPLLDDQALFEFLTLETFQAGLSWLTILRKREHFRMAFDQFDYTKIAHYGPSKVQELLQNAGIVRNKMKIEAAIANAQAFIALQEEYGSFGRFIWTFVDFQAVQNHFTSQDQIPATTPLAEQISRVLKQKGFKFVGSTVIYAHMQATGMVNDHETQCFRYQEIRQLKKRPLDLKR
jgi:DNA-3-methyladenine glycosylase I